MTEVQTVGLAGLRFGGALAACAAQRRPDVKSLALWDPVSSGGDFLESLQRSVVGDDDGDLELQGDVYSPELKARLRALSPDSYSPGLPPTLIMSTRSDDAAYRPLEHRLKKDGAECSVLRCPGPNVWEESRLNRGLPVEAIGMMSEWMAKTTS
jgi:pimeloyl-ACP methyl ester carboxylesterase